MASQNLQNLTINLRVGGKDKAISDVNELKRAIIQLEQEVEAATKKAAQKRGKTPERQAQQAQERDFLGAELDRARKSLGDFEQKAKEVRRIGEDTTASWIRFGGAVTSGFAAARAAISLFGSEGKELNEAAAKAQVALTLGLAANAIAQERATLTKIKDTAVTIANTVAQQGLIASLRLLWATMLANPITAILAALGALVTLFIAFADKTEDTAEKLKSLAEIQAEQAQATIIETKKLEILYDIINDGNQSLDARNGAYNELKKILPELEGLTLEQAQAQGALNNAYEREITLIKLRAQAKGLEEFIAQQEKERVGKLAAAEAQKLFTDELAKTKKQQEEYARFLSQGGQKSFEEYNRETQAFITATGKVTTATKERSVVEQELYDITSQIQALEKQRKDEIDAITAAEEKRKKSVEQANKERDAYLKLLLELYAKETELLLLTEEITQLDNELINTTKEKISTAEGYKKVLDKLIPIQTLYKDAVNGTIVGADNLGLVFEEITGIAEDYIEGADNATYSTEKFNDELQKAIDKVGGLTEAQQKSLDEWKQNYNVIFETFQLLQQFGQEVNDPLPADFVERYERVVTDLNLATGKIQVDPYGREGIELEVAKKNAFKLYEAYKTEFVDRYTKMEIARARATGKFTEEYLKENEDAFRKIGEDAFNALSGVGNVILKFEADVNATTEEVKKLKETLAGLSGEALQGFLVSNAPQIAAEYAGIVQGIEKTDENLAELREKLKRKDYSDNVKYNDAIISLQESLYARGIDISTLTYAQKLVFLEAFLAEEVQMTNEAEDKKAKKIQETQSKIQQTITDLTGALTSISQTVADYYAAQLDNLDRESERTKEKIIGDSEEAAAKRLEAEEYYAKKKKEIEKQSNLQALRFSQIQTIANIAEAISKVTAQTGVAGIIAAAVVSASGAAQIAIIQSQINSLQSMQRGGLIKGQGGLLVGPSHEYGGIRYGAMGLELEGGEAVINRNSRIRYNDLLSQINISGGGRPLVQNNFDDSRIVEAIAKQRQEPIRAYVIESDITNKQAISRRLERLSQF